MLPFRFYHSLTTAIFSTREGQYLFTHFQYNYRQSSNEYAANISNSVRKSSNSEIELVEYLVSSGTDKFSMVVVYRTSYSKVHPITISAFLD